VNEGLDDLLQVPVEADEVVAGGAWFTSRGVQLSRFRAETWHTF